MAVNGNPNAYSIKVPMRDKNNCDFSYAGLKNSFRMAVMKAREDLGISDYDRLLTHSLNHSLTHSYSLTQYKCAFRTNGSGTASCSFA